MHVGSLNFCTLHDSKESHRDSFSTVFKSYREVLHFAGWAGDVTILSSKFYYMLSAHAQMLKNVKTHVRVGFRLG